MEEAKEPFLPKSREDLKVHWQRHIAQAEQRQIPITHYCREQGISTASYYYWRAVFQGKKRRDSSRSKNFVRVQVASTSSPTSIRLELGRGVFLSFDREPSVDWIRALVRSLGEASS